MVTFFWKVKDVVLQSNWLFFFPPLICQKWLVSWGVFCPARVYQRSTVRTLFLSPYGNCEHFDMHKEEWYSVLSHCDIVLFGRRNGLYSKILYSPNRPFPGSFTFSQVLIFIHKMELIIFNLPIICFVLSHRCIEYTPVSRDCGMTELLWTLIKISIHIKA